MEEGKRLSRWRGWDLVERALLGLTFGCFALTAALIAAVGLKALMEAAALQTVALCLTLPCLLLAGLAALCRRAREDTGRRFGLLLFLGTLALKGAFVILTDTQPVSDFKMLYETAQWLAEGPVPLTALEYFVRWPYQSWFVAYMAGPMALFGADVLFFKLVNALASALTGVLVYALARRFASEGGARGAALLYACYPGTWLLVPVLTNQHLSDLLLLLALWLYTAPAAGQKRRLALAGAAGAALALGNAFRPAAAVALAAAGCLLVLELLRERREGWRAVGNALARFLLLAAAYSALMWGFGQAVRLSGLNEYGLGSSCPEWKFVCGLNEETCGGYSKQDAGQVFGAGNPREEARKLIGRRLSVPPDRLAKLAWDKIEKLWGGCETLEWTVTENVAEALDRSGLPGGAKQAVRVIQRASSGCYVWCFLLAAAGGAAALRSGARSREAAQLLALAALAYFGVHLFIEVQVRYRLLMYALAFPLAAAGLDGLWAMKPKLFHKMRKRS